MHLQSFHVPQIVQPVDQSVGATAAGTESTGTFQDRIGNWNSKKLSFIEVSAQDDLLEKRT